jgi:hypothetical protein
MPADPSGVSGMPSSTPPYDINVDERGPVNRQVAVANQAVEDLLADDGLDAEESRRLRQCESQPGHFVEFRGNAREQFVLFGRRHAKTPGRGFCERSGHD